MGKTIKPTDFLYKFSPKKRAELIYFLIDERSFADKLSIGKYIPPLVKKVAASYVLWRRDTFIEKLQDEIREKYGEHTYQGVKKYLRDAYAGDHLRKFEYIFQADCLINRTVKKKTIVDLGGGGSMSTILPFLLKLPYERLLSIDVLHFPFRSRFGIEYIFGNCQDTNLPSNSVDIVTIISTLEHVGLGRYGDPQDTNGDIKTMDEIHRILKKNGHAIVTIPYGYPTVVYNIHRIYDQGRVSLITKKFKIVKANYSLLGKRATRKDVEGKKAVKNIPGFYRNIPQSLRNPDPQGGIMLFLRKV
ncbi:DUF268 domain-containing protein [Candidatus Gottesmanbacteria bacterium]|nr:DUF268 domain-containing protein [Candidatus Gottesmanbacteria bacterium]